MVEIRVGEVSDYMIGVQGNTKSKQRGKVKRENEVCRYILIKMNESACGHLGKS